MLNKGIMRGWLCVEGVATSAIVQGQTQNPKKVVVFRMCMFFTDNQLSVLVHQRSVINSEDTIDEAGMVFIHCPVHKCDDGGGNYETKVTVT